MPTWNSDWAGASWELVWIHVEIRPGVLWSRLHLRPPSDVEPQEERAMETASRQATASEALHRTIELVRNDPTRLGVTRLRVTLDLGSITKKLASYGKGMP